jgi:deoxyribonuclease V
MLLGARACAADVADRPTDAVSWPPMPHSWPMTAEELVAVQMELARARPPPWRTPSDPAGVAGCFVCFERGRSGPGAAGERGWAAACLIGPSGEPVTRIVRGPAGAPYEPGLLALREGPLLEAALRALPGKPDLVMVNATGRDHPRRAGLALQLGARVGLPSFGVTNRPLLATGARPDDQRGATSPLSMSGEIVAHWVRTRRGTRPLVAHAGWRTDPDQAIGLLLRLTPRWRTPLPLRVARQAARLARATDASRGD